MHLEDRYLAGPMPAMQRLATVTEDRRLVGFSKWPGELLPGIVKNNQLLLSRVVRLS